MKVISRFLGLMAVVATFALMFFACKPSNYLSGQINQQLPNKNVFDAYEEYDGCGCNLMFLASTTYGVQTAEECDEMLFRYYGKFRETGVVEACTCEKVGLILKEIRSAGSGERVGILEAYHISEEELLYLHENVYPNAEQCAEHYLLNERRSVCISSIIDYLKGEVGLNTVAYNCPCNEMYPWVSEYGWAESSSDEPSVIADSVSCNYVLAQICNPSFTSPSSSDSSHFQVTAPGCFQENPASNTVYFYQLFTVGGNLIQSGNFSNELCLATPGSPGIYYLKIYVNGALVESKKVYFS